MNPLIIILGVVVVFLAYKLYVIYTSAPVVASNVYLGSTTSQVPPVSASSISTPNNSTYTIGFWIYINTFSQNIDEFLAFGNTQNPSKTVTYINSEINLPSDSNYNIQTLSAIPHNVCTFSMDNNTPTLYANISTYNTAGAANYTVESIPITTNMPIQTWTYVLVAVSTNAGNYSDCYINGKLLVSQQLKNPPFNIGSTSTTTNKIINTFIFPKQSDPQSVVDVYLTKISWIPTAIDPQTAWYYYNQGNGNPSGPGTMSSYHLAVELTKDADTHTWNIF